MSIFKSRLIFCFYCIPLYTVCIVQYILVRTSILNDIVPYLCRLTVHDCSGGHMDSEEYSYCTNIPEHIFCQCGQSGSPLQSYTYHPRFPVISSGNELEEEHVLLLTAQCIRIRNNSCNMCSRS